MALKIKTATRPFFTLDEMKHILSLDEDFFEDAGNADRFTKEAWSISQFLLNKTGYDWSNDQPRHPTANDCASMLLKQWFYEDDDKYSEQYDYQLGISEDIRQMITLVREAESEAENG